MTSYQLSERIQESLRDWFKKEDWVRINTSGNISGKCGTMKKGKATTRCLPKKKAQSLTKEEALACFGAFYFEEVLNDPTGTGHQNIRNFMNHGFDGLAINGTALSEKGV